MNISLFFFFRLLLLFSYDHLLFTYMMIPTTMSLRPTTTSHSFMTQVETSAIRIDVARRDMTITTFLFLLSFLFLFFFYG